MCGNGVRIIGTIIMKENKNETKSRLLRGGSWIIHPANCRSAFRSYRPGGRSIAVGFRVCCLPQDLILYP
jgi:formylglycine-generating enzyme required for sulfatase activity